MAAIGEELGLTGLLAILLVYAIIIGSAASAPRSRSGTGFGKLLAAGLAVSLALQVFVVVGGVTQLIPLTGLTTPFLSYGGSSLIASWSWSRCCCASATPHARPPPHLRSRRGRRDAGGQAVNAATFAGSRWPAR